MVVPPLGPAGLLKLMEILRYRTSQGDPAFLIMRECNVPDVHIVGATNLKILDRIGLEQHQSEESSYIRCDYSGAGSTYFGCDHSGGPWGWNSITHHGQCQGWNSISPAHSGVFIFLGAHGGGTASPTMGIQGCLLVFLGAHGCGTTSPPMCIQGSSWSYYL